jgi:hypothetical protein
MKQKKMINYKKLARCRWVTSIILATWEARLGRLRFKALPGKWFSRLPSPQYNQSNMH